MSGERGKSMTFKQSLHIIFVCLVLALGFMQCNDPIGDNPTGDELVFSTDTLSFDTLFTTLGSTTQIFSVRNPYAHNLVIDKIELAGQNSCFRLNVDGLAGNAQSEIELRAHDSIFVFVEVTIDPNNENNPVLIEDSIAFTVKGKKSHVLLQAYGQDVQILRGQVFETGSLHAEKPFLVYDSLVIKQGHTLTIKKGQTLYFHKDAALVAYGILVVNGTVEEPVTFRGDRLDELWTGNKYDYNSGLWWGIELHPSEKTHSIRNACIRNSIAGVIAPVLTDEATTKIELLNTVIHNNTFSGLLAVNSEIEARNCQITNCENYNLNLIGGKSRFIHCTIANYYGMYSQRAKKPALLLENVAEHGPYTYAVPMEKSEFINCIIDGEYQNEIQVRYAVDFDFHFSFTGSSVKLNKADSIMILFGDRFKSCIFNDSTKFLSLSRYKFDYSLDTLSKMRDVANPAVIVQFPEMEFDIKGNSRLADGKPDLGAYEFVLGKEEKSALILNQKKNRIK
jgi:hypothetical protein